MIFVVEPKPLVVDDPIAPPIVQGVQITLCGWCCVSAIP